MVAAFLAAAPVKHFDVAASFMAPAKPGGSPFVGVLFSPTDPDVHINEIPPPRLELEAGQKVLVDKQPKPPASEGEMDPDLTKYLDLSRPVKFPVVIARGASSGTHSVRAKVIFFYCSKREGWCRRGAEPLELSVDVP
jgi:hypothetical protein